MVAVKQGGAAEESNAALRAAIIKARAANMPKDNIDRAIKKASGENDGVVFYDYRIVLAVKKIKMKGRGT